MASIADLNVRLGLIYKDFDKGLETVERKLRSSGRRLSDLGDQLTVAISLPLAAAGAAAVKSAGDIESLQLALESQLGSTEKARKELELLRQEALKPGLGFEQAVRASVSLQAVGFSAEKARKITSEFGNALANAGKGAQELDGVILALTQIQAKGIVSAEEINQIAERLPNIRTLMQQAFGTASSEAIQKLGISSQQFIEGITNELQKLPRATGGIKNSLENFFQSIQQGAAKFGFAISKAIDLPAKLESFAAGIGGIADAFSNLNPEVQQFVVYAGLAVVAAGPLAKVFGAIKLAGAQMIDVLQGAGGVIKGATSTVLGLADSVNRLKLAFGIVGIVTAAAAAVYLFAQRFDAAAYAQEQFAEGQKQVIEQTSKEIGLVNQNFEALKKEGLSRVEKGKIIDQLLTQYPTYLRGIDLETASVAELTKIQKGLNEQILRGVAERQKATAITGIYEKQAQILLRIQQIRDGAEVTASEATLIDTGDMVRAGGIAQAVILKLQGQAEQLGSQVTVTASQFDKAFGTINRAIDPTVEQEYKARDAYYAARDAQEERVKTVVKTTDATKKEAKATKEVVTELDAYLNNLHKIEQTQNKIREAAASMGLSPLENLPQAGTGPVASNTPAAAPNMPNIAAPLTDAVTPMKAAGEAVKAVFQDIGASWVTLFTSFDTMMPKLVTGFAGLFESFTKNGEAAAAVNDAVLSSVIELTNAGVVSTEKFAQAAAAAAVQTAKAYAVKGIYAAVSSALENIPFPFGIAAAALAAGGAAALLNGLTSKIKAPKFATGTNFHKGGFAITSENGPELLNLPRGTQVTPNPTLNRLLGNSGGDNMVVTHRISGSDLLFIVERAQANARRTRGF